jgi:hypothetical protein
VLAAALVVAGIQAIAATPASADSLPTWDAAKPCPSFLVIGARGSGEEDGNGGIPTNSATLGLGPEVYGFAAHLSSIAASKGKGSVTVWNNPYPAVPVSRYSKDDPGLFPSVDQGVTNTRVMVHAVATKCGTSTKIILAGFSQGAWVSHDGADFVIAGDRQYIAALVLIADPGYSAADHGILVGTAEKGRDGVIGPVGPPTYLKNKTVSVCDKGDAVCQTGLLDLAVGGSLVHTVDYQDPITQIVTASVAYQLAFPSTSGGSGSGGSTSALDLVFAIDTTGSMAPYISSTVASAQSIIDVLAARHVDYRIGVVDYKDADGCGDYDAVTDLSLSSDTVAIKDALSRLQSKVSGGCDYPEDVLSGVDRALSLPWRNGVKKVVVQMGDAPGKDPEVHSGLTLTTVAAHAKAVDPAIIDPILVGPNSDAHDYGKALADATDGQTFDATGTSDVGQVVVDAIGEIVSADLIQFVEYPGHVVVDATSPRGAVVNYATPAVNDGTATPPQAQCASTSGLTSGSTFHIGDTTVTCEAHNNATGSTATLTFVVTVDGAQAQLANLLRVVRNLPPGTSLPDKVQAAISALRTANVSSACTTLRALANEAHAQTGKRLTPLQGDYVASSSTRIRTVLGC